MNSFINKVKIKKKQKPLLNGHMRRPFADKYFSCCQIKLYVERKQYFLGYVSPQTATEIAIMQEHEVWLVYLKYYSVFSHLFSLFFSLCERKEHF